MRVRHVAFVVNDLEESAQFYEEVLGFRRVGARVPGNFPGKAMDMSDGELNFSLLQPAAGNADAWNGSSLGPIHLGVVLENIEHVDTALRSHGIEPYAQKGDPLMFFKFTDHNGVEFDVSTTNTSFPFQVD
jgi:catechol 2,3-dioxygenase-like lactoylglutathione lyase family enzyme